MAKHAVHSNLRGMKKTRSGCLSCKRRKKKCDEDRPRCSNCTRLNLECSYQLLLNWNKLHQITAGGQNFLNLSKESSFLPLINCSLWEVSLSYYFKDTSESHLTPKLNTLFKKSDSDDEEDDTELIEVYETSPGYLFEHYIKNISMTRTFSDSNNTFNEFFSIIIPRCNDFAALYQSVLCMSAIDLLKQEKNTKKPNAALIGTYQTLFLKFKDQAINELHLILDNHDISELKTLEELVVTIMILCSSEIANSCDKNWANLMKEGCLVFSSLEPDQILSSNVLMFVYRYFSLRYVFLICTLKSNKFTDFVEKCQWNTLGSFFDNDTIDHMFGCSPRLLYTIYQLASLNHLHDLNTIEIEDLEAKYMEIWEALCNLDQKSSENSTELELCAHAYFLGTKVYLCTLLSMGKLRAYYMFRKTLESLIPELSEVLMKLSKVNSKVFFPSWSLLILSSCLVNTSVGETNRLAVIEILRVLRKKWPFSTILHLKQAIQSIWNIYDLCIDDPSGFLGFASTESFSSQNDWRNILDQVGLLLPLV
ncbi:unnamed protein product [Kuraishia capsulata CBS 1993]|uniref:Zn(2)-C6 fungal-type domain-containing protein n=1 Tax=Kuraishia capsulata CBS 1993 TaxID=1382522 RepID=W6ML19_9ASCO|nr:uncharacterized protein KUCA_T00003108001 [Kuraishia capsulata CBS 1993]CDK27131.1 unnamed protein product [Kuraishia capsulata CBS 1993]